MPDFISIHPYEINENVFSALGKNWMLITAGTKEKYNTMTASWGGMGVIWERNVCWCVVRPTRFTYQFMNSSEYFTLSFFEDNYRDVLELCGSTSGKEVDKVKKTGITPIFSHNGGIYFDEARLVFECKKLYFQDLNPAAFVGDEIEKFYPNKDYHRLYVGEIKDCLRK